MSDDPERGAPTIPPKNNKTSSSSGKGAHSIIAFNPDIKIFTDQPLPQYDRGTIKAYKAAGQNKVPQSLIAFICERHLVPRWQKAGSYVMIGNPNAANLVATGAALWPIDQVEKFIIIYENNWGEHLFAPDKLAYGIKSDTLTDYFLPPMLRLLKDFQDKGFVHGGIRVNNLYQGAIKDKDIGRFILGDALSTPPSYMQPAIYEPIERAMADPVARGQGHFVDDIYSLGVTLAILLRVHNPTEGFDKHKIIREKIDKGSYAALTGTDRFNGAVLELLRGILHDNKSERWGIEEALNWMDGQRLTPKQALKRKKAPRVFHVEGQRYSRPEFLAYDLPQHTNIIAHNIEDQKLELWIERSLEDKNMFERYEQSVIAAQDSRHPENFHERLAARLSITLDPTAPLRYMGKSVFPEGIGTALAEAFALQTDLNIYVDIIDQVLVLFWLNSQNDRTIDYGSISTRFESCRMILKNKGVGYGLERCLYYLNPEAPCYSPKLKDYFVKTPEELLLAYEQIAAAGQMNGLPLDRHAVAFLSSKDSRILDGYLIELNSPELYKNTLGNVWAITNIQKRYNMPPLIHLAEYVVKIMSPVLEKFHDKNLRERLSKEFDKIKKNGELERLATILEDVEIFDRDTKNFFKAMTYYDRLEREKKNLLTYLGDRGGVGQARGRMIAAFISTAIGAIAIVALAMISITNPGAIYGG